MTDDWDYQELTLAPDWQECTCGRARYNANQFSSCYDCFIERRSDYVTCILCGKRWHSPDFPTCFLCRRLHPDRQEAARDLRLSILIRDDFRCRECESRIDLQVDHVKPCAAGGTADPWNLQLLCGACNRYKGSTWWASRSCKWFVRYEEQLADYFIGLRSYLSDEDKQRLSDEVARWRLQNGHDTPVAWKPIPPIEEAS